MKNNAFVRCWYCSDERVSQRCYKKLQIVMPEVLYYKVDFNYNLKFSSHGWLWGMHKSGDYRVQTCSVGKFDNFFQQHVFDQNNTVVLTCTNTCKSNVHTSHNYRPRPGNPPICAVCRILHMAFCRHSFRRFRSLVLIAHLSRYSDD